MEVDDRQVTTVFTVEPSFHHRHSTIRVSWSVTIVGKRRGEVWLRVRRQWKRFMILGLSSADGRMTVGLWKLSSLDGRRPPWYRPQTSTRTTTGLLFLSTGNVFTFSPLVFPLTQLWHQTTGLKRPRAVGLFSQPSCVFCGRVVVVCWLLKVPATC